MAESFSSVKVSTPCLIVNAHLVAGAATHDCRATCQQSLVLFKIVVDCTSMHVLEKSTDFFALSIV